MGFFEKKTNARSLDLNVKDIDTVGRVITLYSAIFDNVDRDNDVIVKGAFKKTIAEQGPAGIDEIWHLLYHDPDRPVTKAFEIGEDEKGLISRIKVPNTTVGNDFLEMYKDGHYKHHSIGYKTIRKQKQKNYNELIELALYENSTVLWAANTSATVVDVKSFMTLKEINEEIELILKSFRVAKYTDETFGLLEVKLRKLMQAAADSNATTPAADAPEPEPDNNAAIEAEQKQLKSLIELFKK